MPTAALSFAIRTAEPRDLPGIFDIYDHEVRHGVATFDTECKTEAQREEWLRKHTPDRHPVIVAVEPHSERVLGWASLSPWSERCAYARAAEVSVYVHHEFQRRGIGKALMKELIHRAHHCGLGVLLARIVAGNPASVRLHEEFGFSTVGVMRRVGEKFDRILDVHLLDRHLDG